MWKKIFFTFVFLLWFFISHQIFAQCEYSEEIKKCYDANKQNTTRELTDFVCLDRKWNPEYYSYQIIIDKRFQEVDTKVEKFLTDLEENKNYYFWTEKQENFLDAINTIDKKFSMTGDEQDFWTQYILACTNLNTALSTCKKDETLQEIFTDQSANISNEFYSEINKNCWLLASQKLKIYKQVAYNILYLNKTAIAEDNKKLYQQKQRSAYDKLLSKFMVNLWYVERIWAKWPAKIKYTK